MVKNRKNKQAVRVYANKSGMSYVQAFSQISGEKMLPRLYVIVGKASTGKSTFADRLAYKYNAVVINEHQRINISSDFKDYVVVVHSLAESYVDVVQYLSYIMEHQNCVIEEIYLASREENSLCRSLDKVF